MTALELLDVIDGIVDDTHPEGDGCPLCTALDELREALSVPAGPSTVWVVVRNRDPQGVMAVHASKAEADEDLDIRTGRGSRPDLEGRYLVEAWRVQDERRLGRPVVES